MANGYIPAAVERSCDPCSQVKVENKAFLGGVLGIDVNGERQPISEAGIVDLTFIEEETREAAEQAIASAQAAAESEQTASEAAASARSSESAAQTAANAAEAAKADAEDAARSANSSKNTAESHASAAQSAAAAAQAADGNAERSAESAIAAAAQAASSAGAAQQYANEAYTSASTAQAAADAAQTAQTAAEASEATASTAATTATQASTAAQTAQQAAEAAQSAAASSATAASGSATAAAGSATQAAASATAADASADAAQAVLDSIPSDYSELSADVEVLKTQMDEQILDKLATVNPTNWLNLNAITDGEVLANGTISASTTRFYTDYIPVKQGDKVAGFRANPYNAVYRRHICVYDNDKNVLSGSDSSATSWYTIQSGDAAFVRVTFDKNILTLNPQVVTSGVAPTSYSAYFEPYQVYAEDFLTPESKAAVQKVATNSLKSTDLANNYAWTFPKTPFRQTVGLTQTWYYANAIFPPALFCYAGVGTQNHIYKEGATYFPNSEPFTSANGYTFSVWDTLGKNIYLFNDPAGYGQARNIIAENLSNCSLMAIGDSTVGAGVMTQAMLDYFTSKSKTLTLIGTLGTGLNKTEGRAGWKAVDYLTNKSYNGVVNPFYNPTADTFDFSYYMTNQGFSAPDFVVIQLGTNDMYNGSASDIETVWLAVKTMIDSIRTYSTSIKILLNLPAAINSNQEANTLPVYTVRFRFIRYDFYASEQARTIYSQNAVRTTYCHLILDPTTDIRDNVHPTDAGYTKMAMEVINQINCWQNSV